MNAKFNIYLIDPGTDSNLDFLPSAVGRMVKFTTRLIHEPLPRWGFKMPSNVQVSLYKNNPSDLRVNLDSPHNNIDNGDNDFFNMSMP